MIFFRYPGRFGTHTPTPEGRGAQGPILGSILGFLTYFPAFHAEKTETHPALKPNIVATLLSTGSPAAAEVTDALAEENRLWTAMLAWLVRDCQARPAEPPVAIAVDSTGVRGLVATRDILPNEVWVVRLARACPAPPHPWAGRSCRPWGGRK